MKRTREVLRGIDAALLDNDRARIEERVERVLASACEQYLPVLDDTHRCSDACARPTLWKRSSDAYGPPFLPLTNAVLTRDVVEDFPDLYGGWAYTEPEPPLPGGGGGAHFFNCTHRDTTEIGT